MTARVLAVGLAATLAATLVLGACGGGGDEVVVPARVEPALAPAAVGTNLALHENTAPATVDGFANAGEKALISDGKLWEIRRADRLVGTLQITTLLPEVDVREEDVRNKITQQILVGSMLRLRIEGIEVVTSQTGGGKSLFVWFGDQMLVVVALRDRQLEEAEAYEGIIGDIIRHQATVPAWKPLPDDLS